jgi:hypothetical protein
MEKNAAAERAERASTIVEQYQGIYPPFEAFYIHSIIYSAMCVNGAFRQFDTVKAKRQEPLVIVSTVQEALTHAAALSRFFWPASKTPLALARGRRLREAFALGDDSPLRARQLRNTFEHFDERLDRFLLEDRAGFFFPAPLVDDHILNDEVIGNIFKVVDPELEICVLLGERFEFSSIRSEIETILAQAVAMDQRGCRLAPTGDPPI